MTQDSDRTALYARFEALKSTLGKFEGQRLATVPKRYLTLLKRAMLKETTSRRAIKAFCQQCMGYDGLPDAVADCTARACPLWAYRPYQKIQKKSQD